MVIDRFDFSPLFRSTIGFDRLTRLVDAATRVDSASLAYPPYNIEKTGEDAYRLTMAVAGFSSAELDITVQENTLLVTGKGAQKEDENGGGYLHRGTARHCGVDHVSQPWAGAGARGVMSIASNSVIFITSRTTAGACAEQSERSLQR